MRSVALVLGCIAVNLLWTGSVAALPQESANQGDSAAAGKSNGMQQKAKSRTRAIKADADEESSMTLPHGVRSFGSRFMLDQNQIWTSPQHLQWQDANWLMPLSGVAAGMFVTDADMSRHLAHNPARVVHYNTLSNAGVATLIGGPAAMWLLSYPKHNEHWRETGFLAGEAALNSLVVVEGMKYSLGRDRPVQGDGHGSFFKGGVSFPSEHSAAAWAVAGVVTHEYPGPLTKIIVYSLASLVDYSRYRSREHFPSDIFIGSLIGNVVAQDIYNRHHDTELGGATWTSFRAHLRQTSAASSANMGSPYVPLDSWVYSAMDRLIAQGYIRSAIVDMRPWTRLECARLVNEAAEQLDGADDSSSQPARIYKSLAQEFSEDRKLLEGGENSRAEVESIYTRVTGISGEPLSQGYHYDFGQTVINDFGRPYEKGFNSVTGFSGWAAESFFSAYASAEFQHSQSAPSLTASARQVIPQIQLVPAPSALPISPVDHLQMLDTYVGMTFENWQVSFGKQSLWWGPAEGGSMMLSDNAKPMTMFRVNRTSPFKLPSVFGLLGPIRVEFFVGQLSGQYFLFGDPTGLLGNWTSPVSPQPMISGERFSFKPTPNVEFGFSATNLFAGEGVPFTLHTYLKGVLRGGSNGAPGTVQDPGDGRSGFDLSYRLPLLRNWVTFYADGMSDDQITPVAYWDRSAWSAGLYISHFPRASKLDLRLEGVYTDPPAGGALSRGFFYWNDRYLSGYTNGGNLLGSWIGRQGQGVQVWSNYWLTPRNRIQLNFRHEKISQQFIPGGGSLTDIGAQADYSLRDDLDVSLSVQYERWLIPSIQPGASQNFTTSLTLRFKPARLSYPAARQRTPGTKTFVGGESAGGVP